MGRKRGKTLIDPPRDYSDPVLVLRAFMAEMHEWERRARGALDAYQGTKEFERKLRPFWRELGETFDRYCMPQEGRRGQLQYRSVGVVPTYDPAAEDIVEVVARPRGRVEIRTRRADPKASPREFIYVLARDGDRLRLARKQWLDHRGEPRKDYL
jgi:hypothetical protein